MTVYQLLALTLALFAATWVFLLLFVWKGLRFHAAWLKAHGERIQRVELRTEGRLYGGANPPN
jgi:hypothetical protein